MDSSKHKLGFSLLELLCVIALLGILVSMAIPSYLHSIRSARLAEACAALLENHHFLQRWVLQHRLSPGARVDHWPALPIASTVAFEIRISTHKPSVELLERARFLLYATPKVASDWAEPFVLRIDQDGNIRRCNPKDSDSVERCTAL